MNDREKALTRAGVDLVPLLTQRLGVADQGRERRPELVARVGDEVDAHLLGRARLAAIDQADEACAVSELCRAHQPMAARTVEAGELDVFGFTDPIAFQRFERGGM